MKPDAILQSPRIQDLEKTLREGQSVLIEELWNAPKALIASLAQKATGKNILLLTGASQEEVQLFNDFPFFTDTPVIDFPAWETMPSENIAPSPDIVGDRYKVLEQITRRDTPYIILSSIQGCLQKLIPPKKFSDLYLHLKQGETSSFEYLLLKLEEMGYQRRPVASDKGEFAVRGGIIDVFPVSSPDPFRLEFWGDDIESIRIYDPIGQKSVKAATEVEITPAQELELINNQNQLCTILDYLGPNTLVIFDDLLALEDKYASLVSLAGSLTKSFSSIEEFLNQLEPLQKVFWSQQMLEDLGEVHIVDRKGMNVYSDQAPMYKIAFQMFNRSLEAVRWKQPFLTIGEYLMPDVEQVTGDELFHAIAKLAQVDCHLNLIYASELEETSFQRRLHDSQISLPKHTISNIGYLSSGLVLPETQTILLPLTEITQRYKIRRQKLRSTYHTTPTEIFDLTPGDMVVHLNNGIGRYLGLEKRPNHMGTMSEFFVIEYAENSKLYVPINQAYLISKYIGSGEEVPKMHTLGSTRWKKAKEQTEKAILNYAADLLQMYAQREVAGGFTFPDDSTEVKSFEEDFPFVETEDQLQAIAQIKQDMTSGRAMDRLVCGDVGYGKTEVAMRAAFKAVADGKKQVAVLVPTTVLAMQHYDNFMERMRHFPINIAVLSRFRSAKEIKESLKKIEEGTVDIVIGTHRIISNDVKFKNLGLIVIDEEQRFGVKAKDHLKKMKTGVDCLTLSATPIPRTLYMSLIGARDMSVINTPPQDRLPIKTIITEKQDQIIKNALLRELARDGQAYYIHNRVETIFEVASKLKDMLPHARIVVGHGQMHADELDLVFHAFKSGKADILVATTIVENGIDIPNANTILIDRSDHFGMADLYQLRGRVGRWNRRAYAYFLVANQRAMTEVSRKRLQALAEASSGYGGGMKVAMRDLEIRGAGDILGLEQSGHVSAIGFHLYCKMLKKTINAMQGKIPSAMSDVKLDLYVDARLPEDYVNEVSLRMEVYQRLGETMSWEEIDMIFDELKDRFGIPPEPAQWLYHFSRIRVYAAKLGFTNIKLEKVSLTIEKHHGKQDYTKKVMFVKPKNPQDLEARIIAELDKANADIQKTLTLNQQ